jgi:hypothetical protein
MNRWQVGDWVHNIKTGDYNKIVELVSGIVVLDNDLPYLYADIKSIMLTDEILKKNGFVFTSDHNFITESEECVWQKEIPHEQFLAALENQETENGTPYYILKAEYGAQSMEIYLKTVDELQHALRLFDQDIKEV